MKMKLSDDLSLRDIFFSEEYQDCIDYYKDKVKNNSEDLESIYYALLSTMGLNDIYQGLSIVKKSELLNKKEIKDYLDLESASLINLLVENEDLQKVVIIIRFLNNHLNSDMNDAEVGMSFFEMIGSLYELGYKNTLIKKLTSIGHMLFKM